jgi:uncharacterized protein YjbJ (UPF0337 family)
MNEDRYTDKKAAPKKSLGEQGKEDTLRGKANQVGGKIQQKVGQLTGDRKMQAKGAARQVKGSVQAGVGKVERKAHKALNNDQA